MKRSALVGLLFFGLLHALEPRLADYDGYFHVRFASLGPGAWAGHDFPWMPFGVFADGRWVDHQLLFHAMLWPFALVLPLLAAAHAGALAFATLACAAFGWLLERLRVPHPEVWTLALLGASRFFDNRLLMPRTQSVSLAFLFVGLGLALERRWRPLVVLGFLFAWTYHLAPVLVVVALAAAIGHRDLRPAAAAGAGVLAGWTLHPQAPRTFEFFWLHAVEKVINASNQAVGAEWLPIDTRTWMVHAVVPFVLVAVGLLRSPIRAPDARATAALAALWTVAAMSSVKWLEYAVPFTTILAAVLWREGGIAPRLLLPLGLLAAWNGQQVLEHVRAGTPPADRLAALAAQLPETDCHVFHADWTDFSELFYWAPQCSLVVGLDPHFLSAGDPTRAALVEAALAGRVAEVGTLAEDLFGARFVVATSAPLRAACDADEHLERIYADDRAALYEVVDEPLGL